ncbi:hypothetical protein B0H14DRAFT_2559662 [Mycena olivaceomarginata]|nr:hypothetical protein B0H14DRAFT_2559662 [Mycena olivaceomarginata]
MRMEPQTRRAAFPLSPAVGLSPLMSSRGLGSCEILGFSCSLEGVWLNAHYFVSRKGCMRPLVWPELYQPAYGKVLATFFAHRRQANMKKTTVIEGVKSKLISVTVPRELIVGCQTALYFTREYIEGN